ncbi:TPA_asm: RNA-directed RNA polymerase, partial [ssRNA phage ESO010]
MRLSRWNQVLTPNQHSEVAITLALMSCHRTTHPDSLHIEGAIQRRDWLWISNFELDYRDHTMQSALHCRQALAYFTKDATLENGLDKEARARLKFDEAELLCKETNYIFKSVARGEFKFSPRVEAVLYTATQKIARILGDVPSLDTLRIHFGPGATTQIPRSKANARAKLGSPFACSSDLLPGVSRLLGEMPGWVERAARPPCLSGDGLYWRLHSHQCESESTGATTVPVEIHDGIVAFVPKSAKIYRTISVEPSLNTVAQLGVGEYMAQRLRREGVDIRDQVPNQVLARQGSLDGSLATADLSSASDTIATELVASLLPLDWFFFLKGFRSSNVTMPDGSRVSLQKFSSMGNGFTFPLETLIFYALAKACQDITGIEGPLRVYGDDIVVPTGVFGLLSEVLTAVGFLLNKDKSFSTGPFRESCGKDYFSGFDIRPVYISVKEKPHRLLVADLYTLHNFFVQHGMDDERLFILSLLDPSLQIYGPDNYGDGHLHGNWNPRPHKREDGYAGYVFDTFSWAPVRTTD